MNNQLKRIQEVIPSRTFVIPDYQRGCAWNTQHRADLLGDRSSPWTARAFDFASAALDSLADRALGVRRIGRSVGVLPTYRNHSRCLAAPTLRTDARQPPSPHPPSP